MVKQAKALNQLSLLEAAQGLREGRFTSVEITQACLAEIEKTDPRIHAFLTVDVENALSQARQADKLLLKARKVGRRVTRDLGKLTGVPVAIKDNIVTRNLRTTAGDRLLRDYRPAYDATVVKRLKQKHAVILGKTNLDAWAMGSSTENSAFGPTRNPHDPTRVPGGSSGGSAAAVAADMCIYALGSDTGGSIRQPAALTGVVGLKPTYGRVSRYGLIALASSMDVIGPLTKTVADAKAVLGVLAEHDPFDATSLREDFSAVPRPPQPWRIGLPKEYFTTGISLPVNKAVTKVVQELKRLGFICEKISLPHTRYALATYYLIMSSEASSNLARYDGVRYGYSRVSFAAEAKRRIMLGTFALSAGYQDQYYGQASRMRRLIQQDFIRAFKKVELIITPTTPTTAFKLGEKQDPLSMYLADIFTVSANLAGIPGINVPVGKDSCGLPIGLQILGPQLGEDKIINLAERVELITKKG